MPLFDNRKVDTAGDAAVFNASVKEDYEPILWFTTSKWHGESILTVIKYRLKSNKNGEIFEMEFGRTGMTERDARRLGMDYKTKLVTAFDHPAYYPDPAKLTIKLIYDTRTRKLLGANVCGKRNAVMRTDIIAVAIHNGMTTEELGMTDLAYAPPFASVWDAVHIAANAAK